MKDGERVRGRDNEDTLKDCKRGKKVRREERKESERKRK